jgi:hypothetical protein
VVFLWRWPLVDFLLVCCFACGASFVDCSRRALAFPCFLIGLLASPLCGAAPTFFAAAKKAGSHRQPVGVHLLSEPRVVRDKTVPRAAPVSDTGFIHPTPHCVRRGWVCRGRRGRPTLSFPTDFTEGVVPDGVARSATLERMSALSLTWVVQGRVLCWAVPGG